MSSPTVLIAGASRGLGLEFARQYAADGWRVIACARNPETAFEPQALKVQCEQLDVTDGNSIKTLATKLKDTPLDLLINSAGVFSGKSGVNASGIDETQTFESIDTEGWMKVLRTNTIAPIMVAQAFRKNLATSGNGKIAIVSSRMGSIASIRRNGDIAYRSSKAALNAAMKSISFNLKDDGITIVSLHPGWVKTDMGGPEADLPPQDSVAGMRRVIASLKQEDSGQFFNYDGQILPW